MKKALIAFVVVLVAALGVFYWLGHQATPGFWQLDAEQSRFSFASVKNGDIAEVHTIGVVTGGADYTGEFSVELDLSTVDTGVEIRDERMKEMFFETLAFPTATVNGTFDPDLFDDMKVGERRVAVIPATVSLHGTDVPMEFDVSVVRLSRNWMLVIPNAPIMIEAYLFGLEDGIERLREVVGLDSITPVSPISFVLVFEGSATP